MAVDAVSEACRSLIPASGRLERFSLLSTLILEVSVLAAFADP